MAFEAAYFPGEQYLEVGAGGVELVDRFHFLERFAVAHIRPHGVEGGALLVVLAKQHTLFPFLIAPDVEAAEGRFPFARAVEENAGVEIGGLHGFAKVQQSTGFVP